MTDIKKPNQKDTDKGWVVPKPPTDWKKIDTTGERPAPAPGDWDEYDPKINGMVVTYEHETRVLTVMCAGITYEIKFEDLFPPLISDTVPSGACDPEKDTVVKCVKYPDVEYKAYYRQTRCVLQINCVLEYSREITTVRCDRGTKKWGVVGKPVKEKGTSFKTRTNFFTCPCGGGE